MKKLGFILVFIVLSLQGWAQGPLRYFHVLEDFHGKGFADWGRDVISYNDSTYAVAGLSQDSVFGSGEPYVYVRPFVMLVAENGVILEKHDYSRPYEQLGGIINGLFVRTPNGGYALAGEWQRWDSTTATSSYYGRYLLKLDSLLDFTWIALDSGSKVLNQGLSVSKMIVASDEGYVLCGNDNHNRVVLTKFDVAGTFLWNKTLPFNATYFWTMQSLLNGNFLLTGQKGLNSYLVECDLDGAVVWDSTFNNVGPGYQNGSSGLQLSNGSYFFFDAVPDNTGAVDMHCMWWDASKHMTRETTIEMGRNQYAKSIMELEDGSIVLAGPTGTADDPAIDKRAFIAKLSPSGELLWLRTYFYWYAGSTLMEECISAHDGGFILTGSSWDTTSTSSYTDTWILKVDSVGCPFPDCGPSLVAIPEETKEQPLLTAYPNPTAEHLHLQSIGPGLHAKSVLRLIALDGRVMDEVILPMGFKEIDFDMSRYPAGMYIWEYKDANGKHEAARFEVLR